MWSASPSTARLNVRTPAGSRKVRNASAAPQADAPPSMTPPTAKRSRFSFVGGPAGLSTNAPAPHPSAAIASGHERLIPPIDVLVAGAPADTGGPASTAPRDQQHVRKPDHHHNARHRIPVRVGEQRREDDGDERPRVGILVQQVNLCGTHLPLMVGDSHEPSPHSPSACCWRREAEAEHTDTRLPSTNGDVAESMVRRFHLGLPTPPPVVLQTRGRAPRKPLAA